MNNGAKYAMGKKKKSNRKGANKEYPAIKVQEEDDDGDDDDDGPPTESASTSEKKKKRKKGAPQELSSKIRVSRKQTIFHKLAREKSCDPRFQEESGDYQKHHFDKHYEFLNEYAEEEESALMKALKKVKNQTKKADLKEDLIKMRQTKSQETQKGRVDDIRQEFKRSQNKKRKTGGSQPYYLKKSEDKLIGLGARYLELKKKGRINKFVEKKRKKRSNKDHRWMPRARDDGDDGGLHDV